MRDHSEIEEKLTKQVEEYDLHSDDLLDLDIQNRVALFEVAKEKYHARIEAEKETDIKITLPDGKVVEGKKFVTRPIDVANGISRGLAQNVIVSKVDGELWDLGMYTPSKTRILNHQRNT